MIELTRQADESGKGSKFSVLVDGEPWCNTSSDDDGFELMVVVGKFKAMRSAMALAPADLPISASEFVTFGKFDRLAGVKAK
jgi:hypothetical protein